MEKNLRIGRLPLPILRSYRRPQIKSGKSESKKKKKAVSSFRTGK